MASSSPRSLPKKICRKCKGSCPPCRPWRCSHIKSRSLEECENEMQKSKGPATLKRSASVPSNVYASSPKKEPPNDIEKALSALKLRDRGSPIPEKIRGSPVPVKRTLASEEVSSCNKIIGAPPGLTQTSTSNDESSSNGASSGNNPTAASQSNQRQMLLYAPQPREPETSHIFLAIAADPLLVKYSKMILKHVTEMPEIPEISSLSNSRCIWPHTVHLTIHSFGKVYNVDIPRIADYCKKNIEVMEPFQLDITGMFHHQKLFTIGYEVDKQSVEPLRQIKMNMSKWFDKGMSWEGYTPVLSILRTQSPRGAKFSCAPFSQQSIDIILQKFGGVQYVQEVIPARDIQLCLARSSTETTFYKNLLM